MRRSARPSWRGSMRQREETSDHTELTVTQAAEVLSRLFNPRERRIIRSSLLEFLVSGLRGNGGFRSWAFALLLPIRSFHERHERFPGVERVLDAKVVRAVPLETEHVATLTLRALRMKGQGVAFPLPV